MQVRVLSATVEVIADDGTPVSLQPLLGAALGVLVVVGGSRGVARDRLKAMLWDDSGIVDRGSALKTAMSKLRRLVGKDRVLFGDGVYRFAARDGQDYLDLQVMRSLRDRAGQLRGEDPATSVRLYQHVLQMWAEEPLAGLPQTPEVMGHLQTLAEERMAIVEALLETQLELGQHREVATTTPALVAAHPLNEHLRVLRMRALACTGRKGRALQEYHEAETLLLEATGTRPGPALQDIRRQLMDNSPALQSPAAAPRAGDALVLASGADAAAHSVARMMNYMTGGSYHLPVDRAVTEIVLAAVPDVWMLPNETGDFCRRAAHAAAAAGIDQFLEISSGLPVREPIHQVARWTAPQARVLYVCTEASVATHLGPRIGDERTGIVHANVWDPSALLRAAAHRRLLDFTRPTAVIVRDVLNFAGADDDPWGVTRALAGAICPGSLLILSVATSDQCSRVLQRQIAALALHRPLAKRLVLWSREAIMQMFAGLPPLEPGVVEPHQWRAGRDGGSAAGPMRALVGMARKP
ncbi:SAM-dependent methyltransferase [Actinomadura graeca]|uniref:SAM-dependent methyltransferase n=1 Tax=Actinomadura graeca TaxID=2750812 RepID=A0ABX8RA73_9ACTN|nr:SAM-dependent methyltransferase [Actinomadura graeca]QXJ25883.1 SAM-dependent methyltransferase [Actinomadura graeca]